MQQQRYIAAAGRSPRRNRKAAWLLAPMLLLLPSGPERAFAAPVTAVRANDFLNSIGTLSSISRRGEDLENTIEKIKYLGIRWMRSGYEDGIPVDQLKELHERAGVRFSWGLGSGGSDIDRLLKGGRYLASIGALIAFEGPNEPNNWPVVYKGKKGGGSGSWLPVAHLMRDLYAAVKQDNDLKQYPVWSLSQGGAQTDNAGLQFLTIPPGAKTLMPDGTQYADYANVHNYIYHPNASGIEDNKTWNAAAPGKESKIDGLYKQFGRTWARYYRGYSEDELRTLPRVTTETGVAVDGEITEDIQALNMLSMYLAQFKRGWSYTAIYLLRDRVDEGGNQQYGFFRPDYSPRKSAVYIHRLTSILTDDDTPREAASLDYSIANQPETVHDLLLQKSDGSFALVIWNERVEGSNTVRVDFGAEFRSATVFDPTVGTDPVETHGAGKALSLTLTDHPMIIVLPPVSSGH